MQNFNRSTESCRDRDLLDVILQRKEESHSETSSRLGISTLLPKRNGEVGRPHSCKTSHQSLASDGSRDTVCEKDSPVGKFLQCLGILSLASLIISVIALQILLSVNAADDLDAANKIINLTVVYDDVLKAVVTMTTLVIVLNLCCLMVCTMQCYFAAKILTAPEGEGRALRYLKECSSSRLISVVGFFVSIPVLIIVLILHMLLRHHPTPALTACIILGLGLVFCILSVMQNMYHWRTEKGRMNDGVPVYNMAQPREPVVPRNELSTLV
ncbi:uncharacterized protein LOC121387486 [Gigantopelta aegis]|uniref:uncharacterized protein LOC121387486 n=1 Tax=Gigantopelta aegis TaxID=1735272 RepID=UPI001B8892FD|nr:uncharacterized protein LOC121387486 [Gigantopelta aegis]